MSDRPFWPPDDEIAAQAFDDFAERVLARLDDDILRQAEVYGNAYRIVPRWVADLFKEVIDESKKNGANQWPSITSYVWEC